MAVTTKVIQLSELRDEDDFPSYAAIYHPGSAPAHVLSSDAMEWSQQILLNHLEDCRSFWINQKKKLRCSLRALFEPLLQHHYGDEYIAVFADHPWQCLLYLHYQLQHNSRGLFLLQSRLDQSVYRSVGWECWFEPQTLLAKHLEAINTRGFRQENLHTRQVQLKRFIDRMSLLNPRELSQADANAMTRRFGKWIGLIWKWSFTETNSLQGFPWVKIRPCPAPEIKRDLEYPVNQWAYIEVLLREDLASLTDLSGYRECEHINRMQWIVTLFNYQQVTVELSFRHPYSLHRDAPDFETALYQARYIFDDLMRRLGERSSDLDLPETMPFIAWEIRICERIMLAPRIWDLFASSIEQIDYQQLLALQNKLPVAFESYHAEAGFIPEHSFSSSVIGVKPDDEFNHDPWVLSATNKPLFYYPSAQPIDAPDPVRRFFLERNSNPWWLGHEALQSRRD